MSDNNNPQIKYDVFISFRGEIHRRFLSHLVDTFKSKKINVFVDDILERGDKIWSSLVGVIEGSSISLIIFSPNYASSRWCLEELVKILECKEKYGQIVIPVFYNVEPTHVRHQSSHKYKNAFAKHERKYNSKFQFWRDALNKSTHLSGGIESSKFRNDAELLEEIVNLVQVVLTRLDKPLCSNSKGFVGSNSKELVGVDGNINAKVESLIRTEPKDTHLFVKEISMSDNNTSQIKYDVFVSFRGQDIRDGFLSHLTEAFVSKKIKAFVDDNSLTEVKEIRSSLVEGIKQSSISLIVFSPHYASSRWCLEELVTILECKDKYGQIVIPVFYNVKPTDVRNQSSESYQDAFAEHERKHETTNVQEWRESLKKTAQLAGIVSSNLNEAKLVIEVVNLVLERLPKSPVISKGLVGIDSKIEAVESLIRKETKQHTALIGIWGMGGIGKTTLAEEVYNKLQCEYDGCYFLAHEREESNKHGRIILKENIFSGLLGDKVKICTPTALPQDVLRRVRNMKVLIVLDDVNDSNHIEELLGTHLKNFGPGTRIIVTTRDEQVLKANNIDMIYELRELSSDKALELFNMHAFKQSDHQTEYHELSKMMVEYAKGIPLILKVLGGHLRGKNKEVWESFLDRLKKRPLKQVFDVLKLSYDDLDPEEKWIFLDLACFFVRLETKLDIGHIKSLLKDDESDKVYGLERLKDKALITFSKDNYVSMHDRLQDMAWEIVRQEFRESGYLSHLLDLNDIEALENNKDLGNLQLLDLDFSDIEKVPDLSKATNLGVLILRDCYYLKELPSSFGHQSKLKLLDLRNCSQLQTLPELPLFLQTLTISRCKSLQSLPKLPSNLTGLDVSSCTLLQTLLELPSNLTYLRASSCTSLQTLPKLPSNLTDLNVSFCTSL